ncbi:MAG TPA: hypothetical protein PLP05_10630 [Sedimentisphaerales bacterium]|nr:hypothetical protein [Sedimentisphaerales bacterium]
MKTQNNLTDRTRLDYWPFIIGPLVMVIVYILYGFNEISASDKGMLENIHLILIATALLLFTAVAVKQKNIFSYVMTALCFSFFCRELHFVGTSTGVYVAIAIIAALAISKRKQIISIIEQGKIKPWLYATGFTYLLSQLIARRIFRHILPNEHDVHVILEEMVEFAAHAMMIITAIITFRTKKSSEHMPHVPQNNPQPEANLNKK